MNQITRCSWAGDDPDYIKYHDEEWGTVVYDDKTLFEFLILEGAQAGLSWITILKRRPGYEKAYLGFDPNLVAEFSEEKIEEMLQDTGIVRNKLKVRSSVKNAQVFLDIQKEFGSFNEYLWAYVDGESLINNFDTTENVPVSTELSDRLSKDLKKRGMSFVGTTIMYAYLQSMGVVNDHAKTCFRYEGV